MKNLIHPKFTGLLTACSFILLFVTASNAQNIPGIQQVSVRAPADIKIDGKVNEWGNFKAYNRATDIFYTMSNDDSNLYLVVHTNNPDVLTKITNQGVVFRIYPTGKKDVKNMASVTFPVFDLRYGNKPYITFSNSGQLKTARDAASANPDSVSKVANKNLHFNEKFIRTSGLKDIDTLISIYDKKGISVAENFDSTMAYNYELAIPLKYMDLQTGKPVKFAYRILIPGIDIEKDLGLKMTKNGSTFVVTFAPGAVSTKKDHLEAVTSTTDFWGEYTLAEK